MTAYRVCDPRKVQKPGSIPSVEKNNNKPFFGMIYATSASGGIPLLPIAQGLRLPLEALLDHCGTKRITEDVHRRPETVQ